MESIESLVRLFVVLLTASLSPAPQYIDPGADLRRPLLSQAAGANDDEALAGVARWQQNGDEVPSDLPDDSIDPADEEPLDDGLDEDEPLDAPLDDEELIDDEELLDDGELIDEPLDEPLDEIPSDLAPVAAASVSESPGVVALPEGFGDGETIVRNPAGGETAEVPEDCKVLVENGRAVVGVGCGAGSDDDGPWWQSQVGQLPPPSVPSSGGSNVTTTSGFPFDDSSPGFPFDYDNGGIVIAGPAQSSRADDRESFGMINPGGETQFIENVRDVERINIIRNEQKTSLENDDNHNRNPERRQDRANRASELRVAQTTRASGKAKPTPCQAAKRIAKNPKSAKQLAKAKAKCRQYKKAKQQARSDRQMVLDLRFG